MTPPLYAFRPEFILLQQEAYLFRSCLTQGLTALRNANLDKKGMYYTAFFQLSIGLERLLKVILIVDHLAANDLRFPTNDVLRRNFGHDLEKLLSAAKLIPVPSGDHPLAFMTDESLAWRIVCFLSTFAKMSRYYNLGSLTGGRAQADPLREWSILLKEIAAASPRRPLRPRD